ncbi:AAA family ATPase [Hydrocarboniclastica marina]|uniref:Aminoglycoside phosphotransferase domain-containing protein n=1 Tax=Hydrocarboniclastica marina TaxID=2259620 RepID=A0A4P7XEF6_9ALTE|nr:bifunctional aminoglycoside phosphotransferase/ATP-binding protein [Hydrocarboniclastica marina]QCF24923.1 hypothetical protein soil367_02595 [Hydrocarboniclastica marina]
MSGELIRNLQNPALFDHDVAGFSLHETHISWVLLTGEFAYKIKKPMDFGFLNFSTLDRRKHFCEEEVRLNQRLAPDLYLDVLAITGTPEKPELGGSGEPIDYAIRMRQFSQDNMLGNLHASGKLTTAHIDSLADQLARFHDSIPKVPAALNLGTPDAVREPMVQNFDQIRPLLGDPQLEAQLDQLEAWTLSTFDRLKPLIDRRYREGHVRECHGDLHLANITLYQDRVTIFDCIEFNDAFRWIDTCNDLAFLLMDLEDRGLHAYANRLLNRYLEATGDYEALALLDLYKAYRATIRAKIALFTRGNEGLSEGEKDQLTARYRQYVQLAETYESIPNRYLLVTTGCSGSGKSKMSLGLSEELGLIRIRSDVERKRLFGLPPTGTASREAGKDIYTKEATVETYQRLAQLAAQILQAGYPVIVDSAALRQSERQDLLEVAAEACAPGLILACEAPEDVLRARVRARQSAGGDASEADEQVLEMQLSNAEPLSAEEARVVLHVQTTEPEIDRLLAARIKAHFAGPIVDTAAQS